MPEEVASNLYRIVVPLPDNPLKEINSYVITSGDRNLVIDTGMNRPECQEVLEAGLESLDVDLKRTDFIATHLHADHQGLISTLMTSSSKIYMGSLDSPSFRNNNDTWSKDGFMGDYARRSGFPVADLEASMQNHPGFKYSSAMNIDYIDLHEGDCFDVGEYHLEVIDTPGHTDGHICLYDADHKLFISGDHVLGDITPNIATWSDDADPLADYINSLQKVSQLEVDKCLPGHRSLIADFYERIDQLTKHHRERANEVLDILKQGNMSAYDIAARMTWSIRAKSWDDFPVMQRWFATGETIAHVIYLERQNLLHREVVEDLTIFESEKSVRL
ncbi:MAG: MBL fold metallo-hydrolase [Gammaproteobacteria bacterium]|nr:MBL fold metallo-hydrolase [Gammaproteobacteria bacterium]|tara:strand:- start:4015 stop:5010 length:996 start_codon:yes stop_codon:yes gene_type:complete